MSIIKFVIRYIFKYISNSHTCDKLRTDHRLVSYVPYDRTCPLNFKYSRLGASARIFLPELMTLCFQW